MRGFRYAWAFLTRAPGGLHPPGGEGLGTAVAWFPWVGLFIGLGVAAVFAVLEPFVPPLAAAGVAVASGIAFTGAFHEDGLADSFDGLGGATVEARLEIMRDSRLGTFGAAALVVSILLRVVSVSVFDPVEAFAALASAHIAARAVSVAVMVRSTSARTEGLGAAYMQGIPRRAAWVSVLLGVLVAATAGPESWIPTLAAVVFGLLGAAWLRSRFEGVSGDILGATEQFAEIAFLVAAAAMAPEGLSWA